MSARAIHWVRRQIVASRALKDVLRVLAEHADKAGITTVTQSVIAAELMISDRQVRHHLSVLSAVGMIRRDHRSRGSKGRTSDRITLSLDQSFEIGKADLSSAIGHAAKRNISSGSERANQGSLPEVTPPVALPEENFRANRVYISTGSAEPKSRLSFQRESPGLGSAKKSDDSATVIRIKPTPEVLPLGQDIPQRFPVGIYARHRALLATATWGTVQ